MINITGRVIASEQGNIAIASNHLGISHLVGSVLDPTTNAMIRRSLPGYEPVGAGSGMYTRMFDYGDGKVTTTNPEQAYNRPNAFDASSLASFQYMIYKSNLTLDASGQFYVFAFDANENAGGNNEFMSIDDIRIYTTNAEPPAITDVANIGQLGTLRYQMNPGSTQTHILAEYGLEGLGGSGKFDMFLFIKKSLFDGAAASDLVMFYASSAQFSLWNTARTAGFDGSDGFEEWAILTQTVTTTPEPATVVALLFGSACFLWRARRRRRS